MSEGGTTVVTMQPDKTTLNGEKDHSCPAIKEDVVSLLKQEVMAKSGKDSGEADGRTGSLSVGDVDAKDDAERIENNASVKSTCNSMDVMKNSECTGTDKPMEVVETNGHENIGESCMAETSNGDQGRDEDGDNEKEVESVAARDETEMEVDADDAVPQKTDHENNDEKSNIANGNNSVETCLADENTALDGVEKMDESSSNVVADLKNDDGDKKSNGDDNVAVIDDDDVNVDNDNPKTCKLDAASLSIQSPLRMSVSALVKKAVDSVRRSATFSSDSAPSRPKTPTGDVEDEIFFDASDGSPDKRNKTKERIDSKLDDKILDTPESKSEQEAAKKPSNCDNEVALSGDTCEDIAESLLDEDDKPEVSTGVEEAEEEEMNEDELLREIEPEKPNNEADKESEPDASLLNESDHEDQSKTTESDHNDSSVVIIEEEIKSESTISKSESPALKTTEKDSEAEVKDSEAIGDQSEMVPDASVKEEDRPSSTGDKSEMVPDASVKEEDRPSSTGDKSEMVPDASVKEKDPSTGDKSEMVPDASVKEGDRPSSTGDKSETVKEGDMSVKDEAKKDTKEVVVDVEEVDSDYEVMEISMTDSKPGIKSEKTGSVSAPSQGDEDCKTASSRKRMVPSTDNGDDEEYNGASAKRTKVEVSSKTEKSSRASTPDSVVCLPYTAPTKDEIKPVCDGDKKLISDKAFGELIRIRLNQCLMREIEKVVAPLRKRVNELQASNEAWKSQAGELQKKILELNIALQRKERRRKARKAKAASAKAARTTPQSTVLAPITTPPKVAAGSVKPVLVSNANNRPVSAASLAQNNFKPLQIQSSGSQLQTIQIPMSVQNQIRSVIGQPNMANVQLTSSSTGQATNQTASNVVQYRPALIQGNLAQVGKMTSSVPVRAVLDSSATGTLTAGPVVAGPTTVRSMLNNKREGAPTLVMVPNSTQPKPAAAQSTLQPVQMQSASPVSNTNKNSNPKQVVVDLTDDDDVTSKSKQATQTKVTSVTPNNAIALRPAATPTVSPQGVTVPVRPGQITLRAGTQIVLNGSAAGPVFFQPIATQRVAGPGTVQSKPQTFIYAPTTMASQQSRVVTLLPQQTLNTSTNLVSTGLASSTPIQTTKVNPTPQVTAVQTASQVLFKHPAPLPPKPANLRSSSLKKEPPKPALKISRVSQGIVLSWNMQMVAALYEDIASYQLYAYQETSSTPSTTLWKKVGDVKALPLPMACTLTQFQEGNRYHFAVRAIDVNQRVGPFSDPSSIHLTKNQS